MSSFRVIKIRSYTDEKEEKEMGMLIDDGYELVSHKLRLDNTNTYIHWFCFAKKQTTGP